MGILFNNERHEHASIDPELVRDEMRARLQWEIQPVTRSTENAFPFLANLLSTMTGSVAVAREWAKSKIDLHRPPLHAALADREAAETAQTMALGEQLGLHAVNSDEIMARTDEMHSALVAPNELGPVVDTYQGFVEQIPHDGPEASNVINVDFARDSVTKAYEDAA